MLFDSTGWDPDARAAQREYERMIVQGNTVKSMQAKGCGGEVLPTPGLQCELSDKILPAAQATTPRCVAAPIR
jgi:hypothetical protein